MRMCARFPGVSCASRGVWVDEGGFTLIEVMFAIVFLTVGLLAAADSFPRLTAASLYGKDQTRAANLAQQQMEAYRSSPSSLSSYVGDYGTVASAYFDQNETSTTQGAAYFTRDVQIQYWTWSASANAFAAPSNPYTLPSGCHSPLQSTDPCVYHVSVTTHWPVRGQTIFTSGNTTSPNGCVLSGAAVTVGRGCLTLSTFISP
jgi:Tfp pilus assembly protein PilV